MKFKGYKRANGRIGVRNYVAVIPSVFCAQKVAEKIEKVIPRKKNERKEKIHAPIREPRDIDWQEYEDTLQKVYSHSNAMLKEITLRKKECEERDANIRTLQDEIVRCFELIGETENTTKTNSEVSE